MALTFPNSALMDFGLYTQQDWSLSRADEHSRQGNGTILTAVMGEPLWTVRLTSPELSDDEALELEALIDSLSGASNPFYAYDRRRPYPKAYKDGDFADTGTILSTPGGSRLRLENLPADFVISLSDYLHVQHADGRRALFRVVEPATAGGGGATPAGGFEVRPAPPLWVTAGMAVSFKKPSCKMVMVPGTLTQTTVGDRTTVGFQAIQSY